MALLLKTLAGLSALQVALSQRFKPRSDAFMMHVALAAFLRLFQTSKLARACLCHGRVGFWRLSDEHE